MSGIDWASKELEPVHNPQPYTLSIRTRNAVGTKLSPCRKEHEAGVADQLCAMDAKRAPIDLLTR